MVCGPRNEDGEVSCVFLLVLVEGKCRGTRKEREEKRRGREVSIVAR